MNSGQQEVVLKCAGWAGWSVIKVRGPFDAGGFYDHDGMLHGDEDPSAISHLWEACRAKLESLDPFATVLPTQDNAARRWWTTVGRGSATGRTPFQNLEALAEAFSK